MDKNPTETSSLYLGGTMIRQPLIQLQNAMVQALWDSAWENERRRRRRLFSVVFQETDANEQSRIPNKAAFDELFDNTIEQLKEQADEFLQDAIFSSSVSDWKTARYDILWSYITLAALSAKAALAA